MLENYLSIAINAAVKAGQEIMRTYDKDMLVEMKTDNSPLTIADKNANSIINSYLIKTPHPIISEENRNATFDERKHWKQCWVVDPLDGTKEFIKKNGEFTVNIALVSSGKPILGVIYVPVTKELYFANVTESTAYKAVINSSDYSLSFLRKKAQLLIPLDKESSPYKIVGSRSHLNQDTQDYVNKIKETLEVDIVSKGSSLKFCLVAEGKAHQYPRFAPTMEWDTAAGQAICEAVGLKVLDVVSRLPLLYNKESLLNPYFLVSA